MQFSDLIKTRRISLGLTQDELAEKMTALGYQIQYTGISHWETGRTMPPLQNDVFRSALSLALEMTEVEIMRALGFRVESDHSPAGERAAALIDQMTPDQQERALKILEALL